MRTWPESPPSRCCPIARSKLRALGDNTGCMALGATPDHGGEERPDRWALTPAQAALAERWGIAPERDLRHAAAAA